jgi:hypothetical protein
VDMWQNKLYEVFNHRCVRITKVVRWIGSELCDGPRFDGTRKVETFLIQMEKIFLVEQALGHGRSGSRDTCAMVGDTLISN